MKRKKRMCAECGETSHVSYAPKFDKFGCKLCMKWVEPSSDCKDKTCSFCPSPAEPPKGTKWD